VSFWLTSGARATELLGLCHGDIDVGARTITVVSKGSRLREAIPASIDDLITDSDTGAPTVVAVLVDKTWHGRLLGYERPYAHGPWPIERVARMIYRDTHTIPWREVCIHPPPPTPGTA
jgi:hypothetical protein